MAPGRSTEEPKGSALAANIDGPVVARASYGDSISVLKDRVDVIGDFQAQVSRTPRHDDDEPGPTIFRMLVEDVDLANLTMPGLYIGRSHLRRISFRDSDLHLSALNWSDLEECDFSETDLSRSDLRACTFVRCLFRGANLAHADLRGSTFKECRFERASMQGATLSQAPRLLRLVRLSSDQTSLPLTPHQRAEVTWSGEKREPGGG